MAPAWKRTRIIDDGSSVFFTMQSRKWKRGQQPFSFQLAPSLLVFDRGNFHIEIKCFGEGTMFTYDSFASFGTFILFRPVFWTIFAMSLLLFFVIMIPKLRAKWANRFAVIGFSFFSIIISAQLLIYEGIIVDEIGLGGDEAAFFLFVAIALLNSLSLAVYFFAEKKSSRL